MTIWVFQYTGTHSAYCIYKTTTSESGDQLMKSLFGINDKMLPYFDNRSPLYPEVMSKVDLINDFVIEPWYSAIQRPVNGEKFYEYPDLF